MGFLLTYLLHTTHAAKLGSRAGLGITLIQYGFAMRGRAEDWTKEQADGWGWQSTQQGDATSPLPTFSTAAEADEYYNKLAANGTAWPSSVPTGSTVETPNIFGDATTEWLSFFLMTVGPYIMISYLPHLINIHSVGWFVLLTSLLGFWRVKRWERGILASTPSSSIPAPATSPSSRSAFSTRLSMLRAGLGFSAHRSAGSMDVAGEYPGAMHHLVSPTEDPEEVATREPANGYIIPIDPNDPEGTDRLARAYVEEARLQRALRAAGLL